MHFENLLICDNIRIRYEVTDVHPLDDVPFAEMFLQFSNYSAWCFPTTNNPTSCFIHYIAHLYNSTLATGTGVTVYTLHPGFIYGGMPLSQAKEKQGIRQRFFNYFVWVMKL